MKLQIAKERLYNTTKFNTQSTNLHLSRNFGDTRPFSCVAAQICQRC